MPPIESQRVADKCRQSAKLVSDKEEETRQNILKLVNRYIKQGVHWPLDGPTFAILCDKDGPGVDEIPLVVVNSYRVKLVILPDGHQHPCHLSFFGIGGIKEIRFYSLPDTEGIQHPLTNRAPMQDTGYWLEKGKRLALDDGHHLELGSTIVLNDAEEMSLRALNNIVKKHWGKKGSE